MNEKFYKMWSPILEDFEHTYKHIEKDVIDWYPSGRNEIVLELNNGRRIVYDWLTKKCYPISENDEDLMDEETWKNIFAERLSDKLRKKCYTQERLSDETGISRITINKYVNAKAIPSIYNLEKIIKVLNCSIHELTSTPID